MLQYANGDPMAAICARGDLNLDTPDPTGCMDSKVTSYKQALQLEADAVAGPTAQGLPPFRWDDKFPDVLHVGHPEVFDFQYEKQSPVWPVDAQSASPVQQR